MNCGYEQTGATVLVQDENKQKRRIENRANIESILLLENDRVRLDRKIDTLEEDNKVSGNAVKSYINHHHSFFSAIGGVVAAAVTGNVILPLFIPNFALDTSLFSLFGIASTIALFHTKGVGYHNWKNERDNTKTKVKLKYANLLKFAINRELKVERNAKLPADRIAEYKDIRKSGIVDFSILDHYEQNHDKLIKYFKENEEVPYYDDQLYGRLISDMVQKEIYDEKKQENSSVIELAKKKVKSYLK